MIIGSRWVILAAVCWNAVLSIPALLADDALKERFLAEYESAVHVLQQRYVQNRRMHIMETVYKRRDSGTRISSKFEYEFLTDAACMRVKMTDRLSDVAKVRWALKRPDGIFAIRPAERSQEYVITEILPGTEELKSIPLLLAFRPFWFREQPVLDYFRQPTVTVVDRSRKVWHGMELTEISARESMPNLILSLSFYFEPEQAWLLHGVESKASSLPTSTAVTHFHYRTNESGLRVPQKVEA